MFKPQRLARLLPDGERLHYLNVIERQYSTLEDTTNARMARYHRIHQFKTFHQNGQIGVIVSGMDCDCVQYRHGRVIEVENLAAYDKWVDDQVEWADGPINFMLCAVEYADAYDGYQRDLALEAFEDGHPHVVYP